MLTTWGAVSTLDRMFDDVMRAPFGLAKSPRHFDPAIDVRATEKEIVFACDVPGVRREDLEVTLEDHVLTIAGKREVEVTSDDRPLLVGRAYGAFRRAYTLPEGLDEDALSATLADGVLTVRIPRKESAKKRTIVIGGATDAA